MNIVLAVGAAICAVAALVWVRSARLRHRLLGTIEEDILSAATNKEDSFIALQLARIQFHKEVHNSVLYGVLAVVLGVWAAQNGAYSTGLAVLIIPPALVAISWYRSTTSELAMARQRLQIEKRAEQALEQETSAPKAWAGRLAPDELPGLTDFEIGRVYQAGSGLMAGDFFDVFRVAPTRVAAVIGDVAGKGIESSITAFQAKYLLRVFLRQFRDPAQALEELNEQMSTTGHSEEFISLVVVVFDTEAGILRFSSAGHPAAWLWHEREAQPLRSTGPLLMLSPKSSYYSREVELDMGDMVVLYTDGLAEARRGDELYGEDRIAAFVAPRPHRCSRRLV